MKNVGLVTCLIGMVWMFCFGVVAQDEPPQNPIITSDNVTQIQELWMLGRGNALETIFSPDGAILAVASSIGIWLYDFHDLEAEPRFLEGHTRDVTSIDFSPDGQFIASGSHDETLRVWDVATGEVLRVIEMPQDITEEYDFNPVYNLDYSPDGRFIVTGCGADPLYIWDAQTGEQVKALTGHKRSIRSVAYSPDGQFVLSGGDYSGPEGNYREAILLWDVQTGDVVKSAEPDKWGNDVAYSPDEESIIYIANGEVIIRNVHTWEIIQTFNSLVRPYSLQSLDFSPDGRFIVAGGFSESENNFIYIWDIQTGENTQALAVSGLSTFISLDFSPDGRFIVSTDRNDDNRIKIWDANTGDLVHTLIEHASNYDLIYSPDSRFLLTAGTNSARVWDTSTWTTIAVLDGYDYNNQIRNVSIAYSYDGRFVATSGGNTIKIWDTTDWSEIENMNIGPNSKTQKLIYRPDGVLFFYDRHSPFDSLAVASFNSNEGYYFRREEQDSVYRISFSPNGHFIAYSTHGNTAIFDATTKEFIYNVTGHISIDNAFSPDSAFIITESDNLIQISNTQDGEIIRIIETPSPNIFCANYSADGQFIVSENTDNLLRNHLLWDANTGEQLHQITSRFDSGCATFSPDGRTLAFSVGGTIRIWGIPSPTP